MSSILTTIKYFVNPETQLSTIVYWLMGSFANVTYKNILFILPIVIILSVFLLLISHWINLIALGKEETETKGVNYIVYGYPKEDAIDVAVDSIKRFLKNDDYDILVKIIFYNEKDTELIEKRFGKIGKYI